MQLAPGTSKKHTTGNMQRDGIPQSYQSPNPLLTMFPQVILLTRTTRPVAPVVKGDTLLI